MITQLLCCYSHQLLDSPAHSGLLFYYIFTLNISETTAAECLVAVIVWVKPAADWAGQASVHLYSCTATRPAQAVLYSTPVIQYSVAVHYTQLYTHYTIRYITTPPDLSVVTLETKRCWTKDWEYCSRLKHEKKSIHRVDTLNNYSKDIK